MTRPTSLSLIGPGVVVCLLASAVVGVLKLGHEEAPSPHDREADLAGPETQSKKDVGLLTEPRLPAFIGEVG